MRGEIGPPAAFGASTDVPLTHRNHAVNLSVERGEVLAVVQVDIWDQFMEGTPGLTQVESADWAAPFFRGRILFAMLPPGVRAGFPQDVSASENYRVLLFQLWLATDVVVILDLGSRGSCLWCSPGLEAWDDQLGQLADRAGDCADAKGRLTRPTWQRNGPAFDFGADVWPVVLIALGPGISRVPVRPRLWHFGNAAKFCVRLLSRSWAGYGSLGETDSLELDSG